MTAKSYEPYDFRQAGASGDSAASFNIWIAKSGQAMVDNWLGLPDSQISLTSSDFRTQSFGAAVKDVPKSSVGFVFNLGNDGVTSLWHVNQADLHTIVGEMLSVAPDAELPDRPLTEIEIALGKMFFEILARSLSEGWPSQKVLSCEVDELVMNPKRSRLCRAKDLVMTTRLAVTLPRGEIAIHWISPKQKMSELLESIIDRRANLKSSCDPKIVVEQLPIEIIGLLGQAEIPMRRLAGLAVGDVVVLNQKIDRPIVASIDGRPFFECWPGKVGATQGLEIATCL